MVAMSPARGTLASARVSSVKSDAAISGSAAFLAPPTRMVPLSARPPSMRMRSMEIPSGPSGVCTSAADAPQGGAMRKSVLIRNRLVSSVTAGPVIPRPMQARFGGQRMLSRARPVTGPDPRVCAHPPRRREPATGAFAGQDFSRSRSASRRPVSTAFLAPLALMRGRLVSSSDATAWKSPLRRIGPGLDGGARALGGQGCLRRAAALWQCARTHLVRRATRKTVRARLGCGARHARRCASIARGRDPVPP